MSNNKKLTILLVASVLIIVIMYFVFLLLGADLKTRLGLLIVCSIASLYYWMKDFKKIKKDGVLLDERDIHIANKANSISYNTIQVIILAIAMITYPIGHVKINISVIFFGFFILSILTDAVVTYVVKKRN